jgi:hypothetical protein
MRAATWLLIAIYVLVPFILGGNPQYVEKNGERDYLLSHWYVFIPLSVAVTGLLVLRLKAVFPEAMTKYKQFSKVAVVVLFIFILLLNLNIIRMVNTKFGSREKVLITGTVSDKYDIRKRKRGRNKTLEITEKETGKKYLFKVRVTAYKAYNEVDAFSKEFTKGSLGILYSMDK